MRSKNKVRADESLAGRSVRRGYTHPPLPKGEDRASIAVRKAIEAEHLRLQRQTESAKQSEYTRSKHELYNQRKAELAEKTEWFNKTFLTLLSASHKIRDRKEALLEARRLVEKRNELRIDIQRLTGQTRRRP